MKSQNSQTWCDDKLFREFAPHEMDESASHCLLTTAGQLCDDYKLTEHQRNKVNMLLARGKIKNILHLRNYIKWLNKPKII